MAILDYQNNETEENFNLSIAFKESFEKNLAGYISQNNIKIRFKMGQGAGEML